MEYCVDEEVREIVRYYVDEDYFLFDEERDVSVIEIAERFGIPLNEEIQKLSDEFSFLASECYDSTVDGRKMTKEAQELFENGDELIVRLRAILPKYCCLEDLRYSDD